MSERLNFDEGQRRQRVAHQAYRYCLCGYHEAERNALTALMTAYANRDLQWDLVAAAEELEREQQS